VVGECTCLLADRLPAGRDRRQPGRPGEAFPGERARTRTLDDGELKRLREAVAALESDEERALLTVLIETGCRRSEALRMRWGDLDFESGVWVIASPKAGRPQAVPLALSTVDALRSLQRYSDWVFPGRDPAKPRRDMRKLWARVKKAAKLPADVHIHDLRRTYGLRVAKHSGILAAQKLLRHSSATVTSRVYTPLGVDHLREITEAVNQRRTQTSFSSARPRGRDNLERTNTPHRISRSCARGSSCQVWL